MKFDRSSCRSSRAIFRGLVVSLCILVLVRPYFHHPEGPGPATSGNLMLSMRNVSGMPTTENESIPQQYASERDLRSQESVFICDNLNPRTDFCEMNGDVRIHGNSSKIFLVSSSETGLLLGNRTWKIKPYARKGDPTAMSSVNEFTVESVAGEERAPNCSLSERVPALVFSIAGYMGNYFHDFTDTLIPLFSTSHQFHGEVQFLITNSQTWWLDKYHVILQHLSKYKTIDLDNDDQVRCFPRVLVGLRADKEMDIDSSRSPNGYSLHDFTRFLRRSYSLERDTAIKLPNGEGKKPRLLIISRNRTRTIMNVGEIEDLAKELGYDVVVLEPVGDEVVKVAHIVNSCDVMMGVHGAGLANFVFLPTNAVLIQVVPWGDLKWIADNDFGEPSVDVKIMYIEYKIEEHESSLIEQYPHDHPVLRDPSSISKQGWKAFSSTYLSNQNVKLDVGRFKHTLQQALMLLNK